jgi:hypothetical protein
MDGYFKKAEKAIQYLEDSENDFAEFKAQHQALKERIKIELASLEMESEEKTQAAKATWAKANINYLNAVTDWEDSMAKFYLVEAKRKRAELIIEMYRSVNSAMKRGNI